jgi:hypothetical protein
VKAKAKHIVARKQQEWRPPVRVLPVCPKVLVVDKYTLYAKHISFYLIGTRLRVRRDENLTMDSDDLNTYN